MNRSRRRFRGPIHSDPARSATKRKSSPLVESLEDRVVLYSATGNLWANPQVVTVSFMPDGTNLGGVSSNMFATFNGSSSLVNRWQNQVLQGLQLWAQQTNINFVVVPDDGAASGTGDYQQGDPGHGDIRIGGYNFGNSALAVSYQPPPINNFSIAGDITLNTGRTFNVGSTYDLMTVVAHEAGHSLGLDHSTVGSNVEMYGTYTAKKNLAADDVAGIRSIYSNGAARSNDYLAGNNTQSNAANLNSAINLAPSVLIPLLDISAAGQVDWFTFTAPSNASSTLKVTVQSNGLSLLAPKVTLSRSSASTATSVSNFASASGAGVYGATLTVTLNNVTPGQVFYVQVAGADTTAMGTGRYALGISFDGTAPMTQPSLVVPIANGGVISSGGGISSIARTTLSALMASGDAFEGGIPVINGIDHDTGVSNSDGLTSARRFAVMGTAPAGETVLLYRDGKPAGLTTADASGRWKVQLRGNLADGAYRFTALALNSAGEISAPSDPFRVTVDSSGPIAPTITNAALPTIVGTAEPNSTVRIFLAGSDRPVGSAQADASGNWQYTIPTTSHVKPNVTRVAAVAVDLAGNIGRLSKPVTLLPPATTTGGGVGMFAFEAGGKRHGHA